MFEKVRECSRRFENVRFSINCLNNKAGRDRELVENNERFTIHSVQYAHQF